MYTKQFNQLAVGNVFDFQGTRYIKQSSRTAKLVGSPALWFYFSKNEWCNLLLDNRFSFTPLFEGKYQVYFCNDYIVTGDNKSDAINKAIDFNENRMKEYN